MGFFGGLPLHPFVIPAVMACSLAPSSSGCDQPAAARACVITLAMYLHEAFECGYRDRFSPWLYVQRMRNEPGARWIWISPWRAGNYLGLCRANDVVAFVATSTPGLSAIGEQPAGGWNSSRMTLRISQDAQWVMVDRTWNLIWRIRR